MAKTREWVHTDYENTDRTIKAVSDPRYPRDIDFIIERPDGSQINVIVPMEELEDLANFLLDVLIYADENGYTRR